MKTTRARQKNHLGSAGVATERASSRAGIVDSEAPTQLTPTNGATGARAATQVTLTTDATQLTLPKGATGARASRATAVTGTRDATEVTLPNGATGTHIELRIKDFAGDRVGHKP